VNIAVRIFFVVALCICAATADARTTEQRQQGPTHVRVQDWAKANHFQTRWLELNRTMQLSNRLARLTFTVNSVDAQINGIHTRLCFPIGSNGGSLTISRIDVDKTLSPILYLPINKADTRIKTICLDAGHGGTDMGEHVGGVEEKKYTLLLAKEVQDQLTRAGFKIVMTRVSDVRVDLAERTEIARRGKADLFVALHFNSWPGDRNDVKGVETYCLTPAGATSSNAQGEGDTRWFKANSNDEKNMLLAFQVQKSLLRGLGAEDRSVKRARFQVLREATMPAILIEGGFLSHPSEQKRILDPAYRRQMARAIVDGILAYKKIVKG
jgi:N-acetylmuramoyl-L-alanine amidase